jgi:hypothetical protein
VGDVGAVVVYRCMARRGTSFEERAGWLRTNQVPAVESTAAAALPATAAVDDPACEPHYLVAEVAKWLQISRDTAQRMFEHEPGVIVVSGARGGKGCRKYVMLRIPRSVFLRVYRRLQIKGD